MCRDPRQPAVPVMPGRGGCSTSCPRTPRCRKGGGRSISTWPRRRSCPSRCGEKAEPEGGLDGRVERSAQHPRAIPRASTAGALIEAVPAAPACRGGRREPEPHARPRPDTPAGQPSLAPAARGLADDQHQLTRPVCARDRRELLCVAAPVHLAAGHERRPAGPAHARQAEAWHGWLRTPLRNGRGQGRPTPDHTHPYASSAHVDPPPSRIGQGIVFGEDGAGILPQFSSGVSCDRPAWRRPAAAGAASPGSR
jgi:hypothetical protein